MFLPGSVMEKSGDYEVFGGVIRDDEWVKFKEIGGLEFVTVYSLEDGPVHAVWISLEQHIVYSYDGILVNSVGTKGIFSCLLQEPFKSLLVIWTIHERELALRSRQYILNGQMMYSVFDAGNYFVIPGSPDQAWEANSLKAVDNQDDLRVKMGYGHDDFVIAIVDDRVNGFLFPKENIGFLTQILFQVISNGKLSPLAQNVASIGKGPAKNLMVTETIEGYASLLENVLKFPSEVRPPKVVADIPIRLKEEWQWHLFDEIIDSRDFNRTAKAYSFIDEGEEHMNHTNGESSDAGRPIDEAFTYTDWEEEKLIEMINARKKREDEEKFIGMRKGLTGLGMICVKGMTGSLNGQASRCIYEPYFEEGAWPFLHRNSLYRGIGLSTKGRRPGEDDVDAPSRLPLLSTHYYRDVLGEFGAYFAIANRIDRIHKNAWIGFQSWRATARKASLSKIAESALLDAIQTKKYGDALYFWVHMDKDPRNHSQQDFWSFCDSINAGNCRMFVDALDAQMYDEHHQSGHCYLSLHKDRHCYSWVLELLVNVWAYNSARRMVYINHGSGELQEKHKLKSRIKQERTYWQGRSSRETKQVNVKTGDWQQGKAAVAIDSYIFFGELDSLIGIGLPPALVGRDIGHMSLSRVTSNSP
ncbi:glycosyl transferase family 1 protein [Thalictrum thalictroides]|uniref:Glycosyl transferase family 1 protein n=1 Tax=Thalictrum thalictroides TaxID=46969 RepID=A0A7J6VHF4_THATH|nr:glycosyl transferase family 1 protein [Thalictrum thalictroides]